MSHIRRTWMLNKDFASIAIGWFMNIGYRLGDDRHCGLMHPSTRVPRPPPRLTTSNLPRGFYFAPLPPYRNEPVLTSSSSIKLPILHFSRPFVNPPLALHLLRGAAVPFKFSALCLEIILAQILFALIIYLSWYFCTNIRDVHGSHKIVPSLARVN